METSTKTFLNFLKVLANLVVLSYKPLSYKKKRVFSKSSTPRDLPIFVQVNIEEPKWDYFPACLQQIHFGWFCDRHRKRDFWLRFLRKQGLRSKEISESTNYIPFHQINVISSRSKLLKLLLRFYIFSFQGWVFQIIFWYPPSANWGPAILKK